MGSLSCDMAPKRRFFIKKEVRTSTLETFGKIQSKLLKNSFNFRLAGPFLDAFSRRETGVFVDYPDRPLSVFSKSL